MNFKNLLVGLFAIVTLSACSGNDSPTVRATASEEAAVVPADEGSSYRAGTPNITFSKERENIWVDGAAVDEINRDTFDGYPMLDKNVAALRATSRAIETKENALELYAGEDLFLAMDLRGDAPALLHAPAGFTAERIVYTKAESDQGQGMMHASVTFDLRECKVEHEEKEQEQGKGEEQAPKEDDKGQDQDQGKGRVIAGKEGEQGQDQNKGEEQEKEPAEVCKTSTVTLHLNEIAREQEQEQGKGEEQAPNEGDQDQGKGEEQAPKEGEQGKDEGPQEEPKEDDKDQDQDQDQGDKDQGQQEEK